MSRFALAVLAAAFIAGTNNASAAPVTCSFEACLAYCKKVAGIQCTQYCDKEIPKREAAGICRNGKQIKSQ